MCWSLCSWNQTLSVKQLYHSVSYETMSHSLSKFNSELLLSMCIFFFLIKPFCLFVFFLILNTLCFTFKNHIYVNCLCLYKFLKIIYMWKQAYILCLYCSEMFAQVQCIWEQRFHPCQGIGRNAIKGFDLERVLMSLGSWIVIINWRWYTWPTRSKADNFLEESPDRTYPSGLYIV